MMSKDRTVCLAFPGERQSAYLIRTKIGQLANAAGLSEIQVDEIEAAVDEACSNILEHAYGSRSPSPPIRVEVRVTPDFFIVDLIDSGAPFRYEDYHPPRFPEHYDQGNHRGAGLYLVQHFTNATSYERRSDGTNRFRLIKEVRPTTGPVA